MSKCSSHIPAPARSFGTNNSRDLFKSLSPLNTQGGFRCSQVYPQPRWPVQERGIPAGVANVKKMWDHRFRGRDMCVGLASPHGPSRSSTPEPSQMQRRSQSLIINRPSSSYSPSQVTTDTCHDRTFFVVLGVYSESH